MSTLLVDIGNTRVKWAVSKGASLGRSSALAHGGPAGHAGVDVMAAMVRRLPADVDRVLAVSVAGTRLEQALSRATRARFGVRPEFIRSSRAAAGVINGYRDVWRLGVDRWVSAIGAYHLARGRDVLVASVGTALTLDLVSAKGREQGRHQGGAIIPGPGTMVDSLLQGTNGIRRRAAGLRGSSRRLYARDTASALAAGARFAAAAFIDRAMREAMRQQGKRPLLLLTGGGAAEVRPLLVSACRVVPDLVLRGLAAWAVDR
jgi:type III pantothenate kinase